MLETIREGLTKSLAEETERVIYEAVNDYLGYSSWTFDKMFSRAEWVTKQGGKASSILYIDGVPILELYPEEIQVISNKVTATRAYRRLY